MKKLIWKNFLKMGRATERGVYHILHENQYAKVVFSNLICADHESEVKFDLSLKHIGPRTI